MDIKDIKVGMKVRIMREWHPVPPRDFLFLDAMRGFVEDGKEYTVQRIGGEGMYKGYCQLEGVNWWWKASSLDPAVREFKEGDRVRIVQRIPNHWVLWANDMDRFVNDGNIYEIGRVREHDERAYADIRGINWVFPLSALAFADEELVGAVDALPEPVKKVRKLSLLAELKKQVKEATRHGICDYAIEFQNEGKQEFRFQIADACHYRLRWTEDEGKPVRAAMSLSRSLHWIGGDEKKLKQYYKFADYIINRSPWSAAFKQKPIQNVFRDGVEYDINASIDVLAGASVALREGTEYRNRLEVFSLCLKKGFSEHVAYLMGMAFSPTGKEGRYVMDSMAGGHQALAGNIDAKDLFKFFANGYNKKRIYHKEPFHENGRSYVIHQCVGQIYLNDEASTYKGFIKKHCKMTTTSRGFGEVTHITKADMLAFAETLQKQLGEAK